MRTSGPLLSRTSFRIAQGTGLSSAKFFLVMYRDCAPLRLPVMHTNECFVIYEVPRCRKGARTVRDRGFLLEPAKGQRWVSRRAMSTMGRRRARWKKDRYCLSIRA